MSGLPAGWAHAPVEAIADVQLGKMLDRSKQEGTPYRYIGNINVRWHSFDLRNLQTMKLSDADIARFSIKNGDVMVCEGGEPGRCAVWNLGSKNIAYQKALHRVRLATGMSPALFAYQIQISAMTGSLAKHFTGSTIQHLPRAAFMTVDVIVPPLPEQKRIADKLDSVLARVDACRDRLDHLPALLKRFRQSILAAATSGQLTEGWRNSTSVNLSSWRNERFGQLINEMRNGLSARPTEQPPGAKILRISAVRSGAVDFNDHRYLEVDQATRKLYGLEQDDLLITRYNGSLEFVGVCARVSTSPAEYVYPDKLIRVRVNKEDVVPAFVEIAFGSQGIRIQIESFVKSSAGQKGVSGADLKTTIIQVPPLAEQHEIVRRVDILFAFADRLEARLATARRQVEQLTPALLAKAFRGELVPQDPADEPAAELLKRLAATRAAAPPIKRGRKTAPKTKSMG